jgi:hypothetical protein
MDRTFKKDFVLSVERVENLVSIPNVGQLFGSQLFGSQLFGAAIGCVEIINSSYQVVAGPEAPV